MSWCGSKTFAHKFLAVVRTQMFQQQREVSCTEILVYIRNFAYKVRLISFGKAAGNEDLLHLSPFLGLHEVQNSVYGLFFGIIYKSAGIDHHYVSAVFVNHFFTVCFQLTHKHFGVVHVFGTSKGYNIDFLPAC